MSIYSSQNQCSVSLARGRGGGGHWPRKGVWLCARSWPPFFRPVDAPHFKRQNFWIFAPKTLHFSRKTRSLDPTFGNPCGTYSPKKGWVPPPPGGITPFKLYLEKKNNRQNTSVAVELTAYSWFHIEGALKNLKIWFFASFCCFPPRNTFPARNLAEIISSMK